MRGAWVEISVLRRLVRPLVSLPVRGAWVEIVMETQEFHAMAASLPVRGAWVEMRSCTMALALMSVAPRAGSVG